MTPSQSASFFHLYSVVAALAILAAPAFAFQRVVPGAHLPAAPGPAPQVILDPTPKANATFGVTIAALDFDRDGVTDLAIGAPRRSSSSPSETASDEQGNGFARCLRPEVCPSNSPRPQIEGAS